MKHSIDVNLIATTLRSHGHTVGHIIPVPDNGGEYEFEVDGVLLSLTETRDLLEREDGDLPAAETATA
jgi:predicted Rdx family selenoprotein